MRDPVGFLVGVLVGAMLVGGGYALAVTSGPKAPRYDYTLAAAPLELMKEKRSLARFVDEELGVACYTFAGPVPEAAKRFLPPDYQPRTATEGLACTKYR